MLSGAATLEEAVEIAVDNFLDKGIKSIDLGNRKMALDAYAETSIRTISGNAQVQGSLDRYEDADQYLSWVSDSPMECEQCREWEGKILRTTNDLEKLPEEFRSLPSLEDAKSGGLFHPNCTHSLQVYIDGYSTPPKDTNDEANEKRRNEIRRLQKLERTNNLKQKIYKNDGQTNRAKGAKDRAARYRAQRRQLEGQIERKSLGWFTGEDRLRRLAEANGVPADVLDNLKGNLPALNKVALKTGVDPRLVSKQVREGVAKVRDIPDIRKFGVDTFEELPVAVQDKLILDNKNVFESEFGIMNFLEAEGKFHNPPPLPENVQKYNKTQFNNWIKNNRKQYTNEYGSWRWDNKKGKPDFKWNKKLIDNNWKPEIDQILAEAEAAGALKNKEQVVAGGLPSSGKTFTLANKGKKDFLKTYNMDNYVILNADDMKTRIILRKYASKQDKALDALMSDTFVNDADFGAGSSLRINHPVMKKLKLLHPDLYDEFYDKTFDKTTLTEIREAIASRTKIGDTGLWGYEAANILHEESSSMLKAAQDKASDGGFNMIHDVTMGSDKPIKLVDDLVQGKNYKPAEVMFIQFSDEQARSGVVKRYVRGNFANININGGRGGRYVMSSVIDDSTKKVRTKAGFKEKTIDILGREAITDNEVFLTQLLESPNVTQNLDDIQIISRLDIDPTSPTGQPIPKRLDLEFKDGKIVVKRNKKGVVYKTKAAPTPSKIGVRGENVVKELSKEMTPETRTAIKASQTSSKKINGGVVGTNASAKGKWIADRLGYSGAAERVAKSVDLEKDFDFGDLKERFSPNKVTDINIAPNGKMTHDLILFRGIAAQTDIKTKPITVTRRDSSIGVGQAQSSFRVLRTAISSGEVKMVGNSVYIDDMIEATKARRKSNIFTSASGYDKKTYNKALDRYYEIKGIPNPSKDLISMELLIEPDFHSALNDILEEEGYNLNVISARPVRVTADDQLQEFIDGEYYSSYGASGTGIYTTLRTGEAIDYALQTDWDNGIGGGGVAIQMKLKAGTKFATKEQYMKAQEKVDAYIINLRNNIGNISENRDLYTTEMQDFRADVGTYLAAQGFQAYMSDWEADPFKIGHVIVLDRTALVVSEEPYAIFRDEVNK